MAGKLVAVLIFLANVCVCLAGADEMSTTNPSSSTAQAPSPTSGRYSSIDLTARKFGGHRASESPDGAQGGEEFHGAAEQGQDIYLEKKHHHRNAHATDRSVAGAGVILGGLAATFLAAVFCYIRATGRKSSQANLLEK